MTPRIRHRLLIQAWVGYAVALASALAWAILLAVFFGSTGEEGTLASLALWGFLGLGALAMAIGILTHILYAGADRQMPSRVIPRASESRD